MAKFDSVYEPPDDLAQETVGSDRLSTGKPPPPRLRPPPAPVRHSESIWLMVNGRPIAVSPIYQGPPARWVGPIPNHHTTPTGDKPAWGNLTPAMGADGQLQDFASQLRLRVGTDDTGAITWLVGVPNGQHSDLAVRIGRAAVLAAGLDQAALQALGLFKAEAKAALEP